MLYLSLPDLDVRNKCVLVRVDFNVPLKAGKVKDDTRIRASLETIQHLVKNDAKVVLMSHLGRPNGKPDPQFSLKPVAQVLAKLIKKRVRFLNDCIGGERERLHMQPGDIILLENLRFHKEEEKNDKKFAKGLASGMDRYVNDAFGAAHRSHASVDAITDFLPSAAGFLLDKEIKQLERILNPQHPFVCVLGGLKISDKIKTIEHLAPKADRILVGGAMAVSFIKAKGLEIGKSKCDAIESAEIALKHFHQKIVLPVDVVIGRDFNNDAKSRIVKINEVPSDSCILDIGPRTVKLFRKELSEAKSVFWNGPMGVFEFPNFAKGTKEIAKIISRLKATTIVGGGDSVDAVTELKLTKKFSHISTGGGASLEFLEGKNLPAVAALERSYSRFK